MDETLAVSVTVQTESIADQLVRGRPLGPWKVQCVGRSEAEVVERLRKRLDRLVAATLPSKLFECSLPREFTRWETDVDLAPLDRSTDWNEPLTVTLECFSWRLDNEQCLVRIPAVACSLFGKPEELDDDEVHRQASIALTRISGDRNLLQLHQRFSRRAFDFHTLDFRLSVGREHEQQSDKKRQRAKTATLRSSASDLTAAQLDDVFGLQTQAAELGEMLHGDHPQSVLIVGPAGVGKTALVHQLVHDRKMLGLDDRKIWSTSGARIVSGMSGLGMWQERCSKLIKQANDSKGIVHFGSLHELMEAGKIDGSPGVASMVRQAISRRRLVAIAECTPEQFALIEREDPMLLRVFSRMELKEPSAVDVKSILTSAANQMSGTEFTDQAIEELYRLHSRFATYSALPATALRLMRTMADHQSTQTHDAHDVARAFARQTGLPRFLVDDTIKLDLEKVRQQLARNVIGQDEPVDLIVRLIATLKARMVRPGRPLASLMFIGPTGVGKTEMAKAIAHLLYSDTQRMIRIDMSEYSSPWSTHKLIGKPGDGEGSLTAPIREQPFSVVLLDEFEKADSHVFDLLLQVLGEGRLTDAHGRLADFRNAVVIMTSNLGADTFKESDFGFGEGGIGGWREHFQREIRKFVRPEFLGRIDRIVPFKPLPKEIVQQIAERELRRLSHRTGLKFLDAELTWDSAAVELLSDLGYQPKYGARPLRRAIEQQVTVPLASELSRIDPQAKWRFSVEVDNGQIDIQSTKREHKIASIREREAETIDRWQALGAMARRALVCSPTRDLENELERNRRRLQLLESQIKDSGNPRRVSALKQEWSQTSFAIEQAKKLYSQLSAVVAQIEQDHVELMMAWYQNETLDWASRNDAALKARSELLQASRDIVRGREAGKNVMTLLIIGGGAPQREILWNAYTMLAQANQFAMNAFWIADYDPLLDENSRESRKRNSEKRGPHVDGRPSPEARIAYAAESSEYGKYAADLFAWYQSNEQMPGGPSAQGLALELRGAGVTSWLEEEHGTIHFFDPKESGPKRRVRCKVLGFPCRARDIQLPENWKEPRSSAERDPLRVITQGERKITNHQGQSITFPRGKPGEALAMLLEQEAEEALWRTLGYEGIPAEARLLGDAEFPRDAETRRQQD